MKKLIMTIALLLGIATASFADPNGGGLFQRGETPEASGIYGTRDGGSPLLPNHGKTDNHDADAPLGTGVAVLLGLGGAYLVGKKRREE